MDLFGLTEWKILKDCEEETKIIAAIHEHIKSQETEYIPPIENPINHNGYISMI